MGFHDIVAHRAIPPRQLRHGVYTSQSALLVDWKNCFLSVSVLLRSGGLFAAVFKTWLGPKITTSQGHECQAHYNSGVRLIAHRDTTRLWASSLFLRGFQYRVSTPKKPCVVCALWGHSTIAARNVVSMHAMVAGRPWPIRRFLATANLFLLS